MIMDKIITIAVPTYNMEEYLERCLESLLIEDYSLLMNIEVLVINDGSKDCSLKIAHTYETRFPEVFRVIDKANGNWGSCINRAAKEAQGDYFLILDADDWLNTRELENFIKELKTKKEVDMYVYNCLLHNGKRKEPMFLTKMEVGKSYRISDIKAVWDCSFFIHCIALKTDIIRKIHLTEGISYCDVEISIYMFEYVKSFIIYDRLLYDYVVGRPGQSIEFESYIRNLSAIVKIYRRYVIKKYYIGSRRPSFLFFRFIIRRIYCIRLPLWTFTLLRRYMKRYIMISHYGMAFATNLVSKYHI